jgi:FMN phosphatase YigB (HAD superfamily)
MKILALDFDGVIMDSILETFIVAYNTYLKLFGSKNLKRKKPFKKSDFRKVKNIYKKEYDEYLRLRSFLEGQLRVNYVMQILDDGIKIKSKKDFMQYGKNLKIPNMRFKNNFHNERLRLQKEDYASWSSLYKPYKKAVNNLIRLSRNFDKTIIITGNKKELIIEELNNLGFALSIDDIYDTYDKEDKAEVMKMIKKRFNIAFKDIYFIDDLPSWNINLSKLGINCFFATWGFNRPSQKKEVISVGAIPVSQSDVYKKVMEKLR